MTTYRESCGTHLGLLLHQTGDEAPCGTCATAEAWRRAYPETVPQRPSPRPDNPAHVITAGEAAAHRRELFEATEPRTALRVMDGAA